MGQLNWDSKLQNTGINNRQWSFGSEFGDIIYRLQERGSEVRWLVFSVDRNYYVCQEIKTLQGWAEEWTKQMDKSLSEAKAYAETEALNHKG